MRLWKVLLFDCPRKTVHSYSYFAQRPQQWNSQPWWHHPSWEIWLMLLASDSLLPSFHILVLCWPCHCPVFFPVFFDILCYCKPGCGFWEGWLAGSVRLKHWNVCPRGGSQISFPGPEASLPWWLYELEMAKIKVDIAECPDNQINPNAWKLKVLNFYQ